MIGLIGHTGFVGGHISQQVKINKTFNSKNLGDLNNFNYSTLICSGMSGVKWMANKFPKKDEDNLKSLQSKLRVTNADKLILISTVDVFSVPKGVDENSEIIQDNDNHYGINRLKLEKFVADNFESYLILRLTGIVGSNLKKNFLYDLKHNNGLDKFNPNSSFQYYPISNLWKDIQLAIANNLNLVHLNAEPISVLEIMNYFNLDLKVFSYKNPQYNYDFHTAFAKKYGNSGNYLYNKQFTLKQISEYLKQ